MTALAESATMRAMGRDTTTRWAGVFARHQKRCAKETRPESKCTCRPSYYGSAYDRSERKHRRTRRYTNPTAARNAKQELERMLDRGEAPERSVLRLGEAVERFVRAVESGVALNKRGRRYKPRAVEDLKGALEGRVVEGIGRQKRLSDVRRRDCQKLCDELVEEGLSGSRVRTIVNAIRSLYRWAQDRELVAHDPAALVRLPAMDATPRDRVATPGEVRRLLDALALEDALPYALAVYSTARRAELLALRWRDVDLEAGLIRLGADPEARKYDASLRVVPLLAPLATMLRRVLMGEGKPLGTPRPTPDDLVCPPRRGSKSGRLAPGRLQERAVEAWEAAKLEPIGLHELRHSAASWMDAAGVPPKAASILMGHAVPERQAGAADITLQRYTHALPGYLEEAREKLEEFVTEREKREAAEQ
jgi:integrase